MNLEILCLYRSNPGRETDYHALVTQDDAMDPEDYDADRFWTAMGGFSITVNRHCTIFSSTNFYNAVDGIGFLLQSLYWMSGVTSDWFDEPERQGALSKKTMGDEVVRLTDAEDGRLAFSFMPPDGSAATRRGSRYVERTVFETAAWQAAVRIALEEYFSMLQYVLQVSPPSLKAPRIEKFRSVWNAINK